MRNIKKVVIILCACLCLAACRSNDTPSDKKADSEAVVASEVITETQTTTESTDITSEPNSEPQETSESKPSQAVTPNTVNAGQRIEAVGSLKESKYEQNLLELQEILNSHKYNISLSVYSIDGQKGLEYNTNKEIFGACTVKAAYTLYSCKQMESGNGNLTIPITYDKKHYEPGTGDMQYSPFGTVFTMETALHKSMSISDNVGYLMTVDYFGREGYNSWISELGCNSLQIKPTVWSLKTKANDLVKIWCEIYNYFNSNGKYSDFLYNSCTNTAGNYATATLEGVDFSHKQGHNSTGDWLSFSDAGIVWKGEHPYVIAILTDAPGPNSYSRGEFAKIIEIVHNDLF